MSIREETPQIDLASLGYIHADIEDAEPIGAGLNSRVWRVGEEVVKITKAHLDGTQAEELCATMQYEHAVLEDFLGEYIPETTYAAVDNPNGTGAHVVTVQPFIEGTDLLDFWRSGEDVRSLQTFLGRCLKIYENEGLMPDIAIPRTGFNVLRSRNILVNDDSEPILVDSTFGKIQRSRPFAGLWARCVHGGTLVAQNRVGRRIT